MSKDLWLIEYEIACDDFTDGQSEEEFRRRLRDLGFDPQEIDDHVSALTEDA